MTEKGEVFISVDIETFQQAMSPSEEARHL